MPAEKIKSKDLSYTSELPPFLQRLHDQKAGRGDTHRHEFQIARPKGKKNPDDDDGPTIVDESGENVSKEDLQKLGAAETVGTSVTEEADAGAPPQVGQASERKGKENVTKGVAAKKRKAGKVIGEEEVEQGSDGPERDHSGPKKVVKKAKKKAKVKLAFEEGE